MIDGNTAALNRYLAEQDCYQLEDDERNRITDEIVDYELDQDDDLRLVSEALSSDRGLEAVKRIALNPTQGNATVLANLVREFVATVERRQIEDALHEAMSD